MPNRIMKIHANCQIVCFMLTKTTDENVPIFMHSTNGDVTSTIICCSDKLNLDFNILPLSLTIYINLKEN